MKNECKRNEQNLDVAQKWKLGQQYAYWVNTTQSYSRLDSNEANRTRSPVNLTNYICGTRSLNVSAEDVCGSYDHLEQNWSVTDRSRYLYNYSTQASSLHPPSALSSGYSSVNQSCASSAGTGSQRSRSPTPDQFATLKEGSPLHEVGRFEYQTGEAYTSKGHCVEKSEELVVCGGGDRHPSNSPVRGKWSFVDMGVNESWFSRIGLTVFCTNFANQTQHTSLKISVLRIFFQ